MSIGSKIEWTEATWNPVVGCTAISPGCDLCYAAVRSARQATFPNQPNYVGLTVRTKAPTTAGGRERPTFNGTVRCLPDKLTIPFKWKKARLIFVNSMSDLFHKNVPDDFILRVFRVMEACPRHTFQVLTKRPERARELASVLPWPKNVWLGASAENEEFLTKRAAELIQIPAAIRFLSCEPLLGPLDLRPWLQNLHWVIFGSESQSGARPCDLDWVRTGLTQCAEAGVAAFVKQLPGRVRSIPSKDMNEWPSDLRVREYPDDEVDEWGQLLAVLLFEQKTAFAEGCLTYSQTKRLERLPGWTWNATDHELKAKLLDMARNGEEPPHPDSPLGRAWAVLSAEREASKKVHE